MQKSYLNFGRKKKVLVMLAPKSKFYRKISKANNSYKFVTAKNITCNKEFNSVLSTWHPDLVVLNTDNLEENKKICQRIRSNEQDRHTGIIFIHENNLKNNFAAECLEIGADDFIKYNCHLKEILARFSAVLRMKQMTDELRNANHRLKILSMTDELTGLENMRSFNFNFKKLNNHCTTNQESLSVIMLDLDYFKLVNDTTNHLVGSYVIQQVGKLIAKLNANIKGSIAARFGGDEFVIALKNKSFIETKKYCDNLRLEIEKAIFKKESTSIKITASIGFSNISHVSSESEENIIKAADLMLYKSKNNGRNQSSGVLIKATQKSIFSVESATDSKKTNNIDKAS